MQFFRCGIKLLGYRNLKAEDSVFLEYDVTSVGIRISTFRGNVFSSSSSVAVSLNASVSPLNVGASSAGLKKSVSLNLEASKCCFRTHYFFVQVAYLLGETGAWGHWNGCGGFAFSFLYKLQFF
jgi:hypothetical protein